MPSFHPSDRNAIVEHLDQIAKMRARINEATQFSNVNDCPVLVSIVRGNVEDITRRQQEIQNIRRRAREAAS